MTAWTNLGWSVFALRSLLFAEVFFVAHAWWSEGQVIEVDLAQSIKSNSNLLGLTTKPRHMSWLLARIRKAMHATLQWWSGESMLLHFQHGALSRPCAHTHIHTQRPRRDGFLTSSCVSTMWKRGLRALLVTSRRAYWTCLWETCGRVLLSNQCKWRVCCLWFA